MKTIKAKEVFSKTLVFGWIKLGLGLLNILIAVILFAILMGISYLFNSGGVGVVLFFVWLGMVGIMNFLINNYFGYLVKAGHVAVIATAFQNGAVPADPVNTGTRMVKDRFGTSNVYFVVDKLVSGAVKQLQRTLGRITDGLFGAIPGMKNLKNLMNLFLDISLGYIDECCLGYTFNHPEQNAFKSAADGVVIYFKNWKTLLKDAAKTTFVVILSVVLVTLVAFVLFGGLFRLFGWNGFVAFVISLLLSWTVKYAFIDSWILVKMMSSYMQAVPATQITFDLYGKLCGMSSKFKELLQKGGNQTSFTPTATPAPISASSPYIAGEEKTAVRFCPNCGIRLKVTDAFCTSCGAKTNFVW